MCVNELAHTPFPSRGGWMGGVPYARVLTPDDGVAAVVRGEEEDRVLPHAHVPQRLCVHVHGMYRMDWGGRPVNRFSPFQPPS